MIREYKAVLEISSVGYQSDRISRPIIHTIVSKEDVLEALANSDNRGRFSILEKAGRGAHAGQITEVGFQGTRKLTSAEIAELPFEPDDKSETESVTCSFWQWHREGRPLKIKLSRCEEYTPC